MNIDLLTTVIKQVLPPCKYFTPQVSINIYDTHVHLYTIYVSSPCYKFTLEYKTDGTFGFVNWFRTSDWYKNVILSRLDTPEFHSLYRLQADIIRCDPEEAIDIAEDAEDISEKILESVGEAQNGELEGL